MAQRVTVARWSVLIVLVLSSCDRRVLGLVLCGLLCLRQRLSRMRAAAPTYHPLAESEALAMRTSLGTRSTSASTPTVLLASVGKRPLAFGNVRAHWARSQPYLPLRFQISGGRSCVVRRAVSSVPGLVSSPRYRLLRSSPALAACRERWCRRRAPTPAVRPGRADTRRPKRPWVLARSNRCTTTSGLRCDVAEVHVDHFRVLGLELPAPHLQELPGEPSLGQKRQRVLEAAAVDSGKHASRGMDEPAAITRSASPSAGAQDAGTGEPAAPQEQGASDLEEDE